MWRGSAHIDCLSQPSNHRFSKLQVISASPSISLATIAHFGHFPGEAEQNQVAVFNRVIQLKQHYIFMQKDKTDYLRPSALSLLCFSLWNRAGAEQQS